MKIAAGICTYAEEDGLKRTLESLNVDQIFVMHGPYPHFGIIDPESIDRTRAVCDKFDNVTLMSYEKPLHENIRRESYLALMEPYDFCITIDSDEYISHNADWDIFKQSCTKMIDTYKDAFYIYDIMFDGHPSQSGPRPRLFYKPHLMRYYKKHYWFKLPNGNIAAGSSDSKKVIDGIRISHDKSHRTPERLQAMYDHQHWLLVYDSQFVLTSKERMV